MSPVQFTAEGEEIPNTHVVSGEFTYDANLGPALDADAAGIDLTTATPTGNRECNMMAPITGTGSQFQVTGDYCTCTLNIDIVASKDPHRDGVLLHRRAGRGHSSLGRIPRGEREGQPYG